ncbi:MAG: hypothetical protein R3E61_01880 [Pseudomonadales bacterium]
MGAWAVAFGAGTVARSWTTRVLALGDSNTYGLYLKAEEAWPAQLEQSWNSAHPQSPIEVLNLGFPATNSFRVLDNLPVLLDKLSPDIVLYYGGLQQDFCDASRNIVFSSAAI